MRGPMASLALATFVAAGAATGAASAATLGTRTAHVQADLIPQTATAAPGKTLYVALRQKIAPGWHTYWRNPGDAGQATTLSWTLPAGWKAGDIDWPAPERFLTGPIMAYVYTRQVYLPVPIHVPADARPGQTVTLKAQANWLVCSDVCIPEGGAVSVDVPVAAASAAPSADGQAVARTVAAAPRPDGLTARFARAGDTVKLEVSGAALKGASVADAYFYPYDPTVLDQTKPQPAHLTGHGISLALPAGYAFTSGKPPPRLQGVLTLGPKAYEIDATGGAAAATIAAPAVSATPTGGGSGTPTSTAPTTTTTAAAGSAASDTAALTLPGVLVLAFLGGMVLNLMPCVFPVLSIKAAAVARHIGSPARARAEGLAFLAGVVASFLGLATVLIVARAGGQAVGWGFQLQSPLVVAVLALVMLGAALNLSGVFEIGQSVQGVGAEAASKGGLAGAFFTGVLAVMVGAPCTAAFMAPAIGWALVQAPVVALCVFLALGLGLGLPFTALSFAPGLFRRLPKPGAWMERLKQVLAFPMYAAAAWLAWVFAQQTGPEGLPALFAAAVLLGFAAFCWGVGQRSERSAVSRTAAAASLAGVIAAVGLGQASAGASAPSAAATLAGALPVQPWSPQRVAALQAQGRPVFVDFTAAWCVTCQVNERTALATRAVVDAFARTGAVYLRADWTRGDPDIARALAAQGRSGVPLYLVYGKDGARPKLLPQWLSADTVVHALDAAAHA